MSGLRKQQSLRLMWTYIEQYAYITIAYRKGLSSDANSPAFGGRLTLFCLVSRSPALVHKSPDFYVHYNIEYLVKNKTNLVWDLAHF